MGKKLGNISYNCDRFTFYIGIYGIIQAYKEQMAAFVA